MLTIRNRNDALAFDDVRRILDGFFQKDWPFSGFPGFERAEEVTGPRVEENDGEVKLTLEAPGLTAEDVKIELDGDVVSVRAERTAEVPEGMKPLRRERTSLRFERRFRLSDRVDRDRIEARFDDGILTVVMPKKELAGPRLIPVKAA